MKINEQKGRDKEKSLVIRMSVNGDVINWLNKRIKKCVMYLKIGAGNDILTKY